MPHSPRREDRRGDDSRDRRKDDVLPEIATVFQGEVASIQPYGIFVKIPGSRKQGLVHKSQMSQSKVENPAELVDMGERVFCKVISIEDSKIGLSMKFVDQGSGQDLDKNQVQQSLDERRRKQGFIRGSNKIELGAVLDTTCKKCGGKGHLASDCFHIPGNKSYELLPDEAEEPTQSVQQETKQKHKKKKKEKKHKHKSKKRKHDRHDDSSDSDSEREHKKHKHKHSKTKHKKRHYSSSESDSSDSEKDYKKHRR